MKTKAQTIVAVVRTRSELRKRWHELRRAAWRRNKLVRAWRLAKRSPVRLTPLSMLLSLAAVCWGGSQRSAA